VTHTRILPGIKHKGRVLGWCLYPIIVREFLPWATNWSNPMTMVDKESKVLLNLLIDSFCLTICLRMEAETWPSLIPKSWFISLITLEVNWDLDQKEHFSVVRGVSYVVSEIVTHSFCRDRWCSGPSCGSFFEIDLNHHQNRIVPLTIGYAWLDRWIWFPKVVMGFHSVQFPLRFLREWLVLWHCRSF